MTYLVGEPFEPDEPLGLVLSDLGAWWFETLGAEMRVSRGEEFDGAISTYAFRSWGAGDGAIAIAVLMMCVGF